MNDKDIVITGDDDLNYPNYIDDNGRFFMVKCPKCHKKNDVILISSGRCGFCGYKGKGFKKNS